MSSIAPTASIGTDRQLIAPVWHTVVLIGVLDGLAVLGWLAYYLLDRMNQPLPPEPRPVPLFIWTIILAWVPVAWVWMGIRRRGVRVADLVAGRWQNGKALFTDVALGFVFWLVWVGIWKIEYFLFGPLHFRTARHLPTGPLEVLLWIGVSVSAGISEEIVFRGYLQRQLGAMTGSVMLGLLLQAIMFGVAHCDDSVARTIMHILFGVLCGFLASWRKSLRPGILGHVLTDLSARLLRF